MPPAKRTLKIGLIGLGAGAVDFLAAFRDADNGEVIAGADVSETALAAFKEMYPAARAYSTAELLCADREVEVVWVCSPVYLHAAHAVLAATSEKHVVIKTPMALSLAEADTIVEAAERAGVFLVTGHTLSFTRQIRAMRKVITSGEIGRFRAASMISYSDWILRARTAHELDPNQGGGIIPRSGVHPIDAIRFLGGGLLRSVRGMTGQWFAPRPIAGYFGSYLEFEDGASALLMQNGYGYFIASELVPGGGDKQFYTAEERATIRRQLREGVRDETIEKQGIRSSGVKARQEAAEPDWRPGYSGYLVVSCEAGDMRYSPQGIYIHSDAGRRDVDAEGYRGGTDFVRRRAELDEIYDAVVNGIAPCHDGRWGRANLEVCLALMQSGRERREVLLHAQVPVRDNLS